MAEGGTTGRQERVQRTAKRAYQAISVLLHVLEVDGQNEVSLWVINQLIDTRVTLEALARPPVRVDPRQPPLF
jgi:hypothetical protein